MPETVEPHVSTAAPIVEDDLLGFTWIADPQISPDGARVAFTRVTVDRESDEYRTGVWIADARGGEPRPLTSGTLDSQPRWSPDGDWIAFVRSPASGKPGQLHVLPLAGGESRALTDLAGGVSAPAWSPDGRRLAFLSPHHPELDDPKREKPRHEPARVVTRPMFRLNNEGFFDFDRRDHVWVVGRDGGSPRALTRGPHADGAPSWSRDGRRVRFAADRRAEPWFGAEEYAVLYAVSPDLESPTDGEALETVIEHGGGIHDFVETADGRIVLSGTLAREESPSYDQPTLLVAEGPWPCRRVRAVAPDLDQPVGEGVNSDQHPPRGGGRVPLGVAPDGRTACALVLRHGGAMLARFDLEGGRVEELTPADRDVVSGTVSADGTRWALVMGSPATPGDLELLETQAGTRRTLWAPNRALLAERQLGGIEEFWYESFDGTRIQGWIMKPPEFDPARRYPMVLEIHGGPHTAYGAGFFHEFQLLAGAGYVVVYTNPRGSTGYGDAFANVIQYRFPGDDARDLLAAVDEVVGRGYVDPARLGVTGGSGGGLLTNWIVTQTDRFAAAVTQRCVSDWASFYYSCDFTLFTPTWFRKPPFEDPADYAARSPVSHASRITTPLMILHSEEDWRTPIGQGEAMFRALVQQRKKTVLVRFPGENHELSRSGVPSRRVENQRHIRAWFDHFLQGKPAPQYGL